MDSSSPRRVRDPISSLATAVLSKRKRACVRILLRSIFLVSLKDMDPT